MKTLRVSLTFAILFVDPAMFHKFFTLRAPRRGGDRESFGENLSKKNYFANFSDAPDARGHRELPVVKISALNDPWRYQKLQKNEKKI